MLQHNSLYSLMLKLKRQAGENQKYNKYKHSLFHINFTYKKPQLNYLKTMRKN